jgi:hypothetical protein
MVVRNKVRSANHHVKKGSWVADSSRHHFYPPKIRDVLVKCRDHSAVVSRACIEQFSLECLKGSVWNTGDLVFADENASS